jgi:tripartite-type tricarboxylate transporter receptor subunit TctC
MSIKNAFVALAAATGLLLPVAASAQADDWPSRPVHLIVPLGAGGGIDVMARLLAEQLRVKLGQPFIVENKPGGGSVIGASYVRNAAPDGYTLLFGGSLVVSVTALQKVNYDPRVDFTPINMTAAPVTALIANKDFPPNNMKELIELAKKHPGELNYATTGVGSTSHLMMERVQSVAGIKLTAIPFNGSLASIGEVLSGRVPLVINNLDAFKPFLDTGRVKAIATTLPKRSAQLPDTPTMAEAGVPNSEFVTWMGVLGPAKLPSAIVNKLNATVSEILKDPAFMKRVAAANLDIYNIGPEGFKDHIAREVEMWRNVVKSANLTPQ